MTLDTAASGIPFEEEATDRKAAARPIEGTRSPGGGQESKWKVVAKTPGLAPAKIIAGRLLAEGIPARAWQEGAGRALGLTVGLLGTGYVEVPADLFEVAEQILADSEQFERSDEEE